MDPKTIVDIFRSHKLDLKKPADVLKALDLLENFKKAKTVDERNKIFKTALRTVLPYPMSFAAGEILVRLRKLIKPLDRIIRKGIGQ